MRRLRRRTHGPTAVKRSTTGASLSTLLRRVPLSLTGEDALNLMQAGVPDGPGWSADAGLPKH